MINYPIKRGHTWSLYRTHPCYLCRDHGQNQCWNPTLTLLDMLLHTANITHMFLTLVLVYKKRNEVAGWPSGYRDLLLSERSQVLSWQTASVYPLKAVYPLQMSFSKTLNHFLLPHCRSNWQLKVLKVKISKHCQLPGYLDRHCLRI